MDEEVAEIKEQPTGVEVETRVVMDFYKGRLGGKDVVMAQSGIGKINVAMHIQMLVDIYKVGGIVNAGAIDSLKREIDIEDIILSSDVLQRDMNVTGFGCAVGRILHVDTLSFKANERLIQLTQEHCAKVNPDIRALVGRIVTGGQFVSGKERKQWLMDTFAGSCTEMEGVAIAQACYLNPISFLIARAISDKADDSAIASYPVFGTKTVTHSVNLLTETIRSF